ncbi:NAD-dependent epimerase/dehydratase family protein [Kribbella antibiotica]|uniref:NAD-dependent epimerase/dehydratase family protein n=1 Tax=Kribbella antibiotica TaxID=190195 RepID=A0A4R4YPN2_9ACTN|nr:NAD(P)H-binding protein [Kribbella antibiotica]TDD47071.1 NAD-dependent epimerase/dehydratase family protein [Kribbella antibiotica]
MIVITGATGNIGRPLTQTLAAAGHQVTAVSRRPAEAPYGGRHVVADLSDASSLKPVFAGAKALFLLLSGDLHGPDANPADVVELAASNGLRRIVLLSSQGVSTRPNDPTRLTMRALEDVVRGSGLDWTILRPGGFASNALWWAGSVRTQRVVAAPFGDTGTPIIDPADIAAVAAASLVDDQHAGATYDLTGPEIITPRQQAAALATALGTEVRFHELTRAEAKAGMSQAMPPELADDTLDILGAPTPAELRVSPDVQRVLGRTPNTFATWATHNLPAFR